MQEYISHGFLNQRLGGFGKLSQIQAKTKRGFYYNQFYFFL